MRDVFQKCYWNIVLFMAKIEIKIDSDSSFPFRKINTIKNIITNALFESWMKSTRLCPKYICKSWVVASFLPFNVVISIINLSVAFTIYFRRKLSLRTLKSLHISQLLQITSAFFLLLFFLIYHFCGWRAERKFLQNFVSHAIQNICIARLRAGMCMPHLCLRTSVKREG